MMDWKAAMRAVPAVTVTLLATLLFATPAPLAAQQGGRARVLVVPLEEENGIKRNFGRKVAEEVRERLRDVATLEAIDWDTVEDELDRLKLDEDDLGRVQWRQLAGRLDADLLLAGAISRSSRGNAFNVSFIDVRSGDETPIPEFHVEDDGGEGEREAADQIMAAVEGQLEFHRALLFCSDYLGSQEYDDARRNCEQALAHNPNSMSARYLMGRVEMGLENYEAAKEHLDVVVDANPAEVDALNSLAFTEAQLGNAERASELYREYLGFNPDDASVRMNIAYDLAQTGAYEEAVGLLEDGIARDSTNAELWEFMGNVLLNMGTTEEMAMETGTPGEAAAGEAAGEAGTPEAGEADGVANADAIQRAVEAYEKVLDLRGADTDPQILRNVVAAYLQLGDLEEATRFAERAEAQLPEDAMLRSLKADVRARAEDYSGAVAAMDEALRLNPDLERGMVKRGFFKLAAGNEQGAMSDLRAAVDRGTDADMVAQQLLSRGYNDYYLNEQYDEAIRLFEAALDFSGPGSTEEQLYFFIGASYFQIGVGIDDANQSEACQPARRALNNFEQVLPNLNRAADQQPQIQAQIRENTDIYLYREQAILDKPACR